ncbi:MAG: DMT family protein, partial [Pseudomonadota bacterium]
WLGHLLYKDDLSFAAATLLAWLLVLPEYALNIAALRLGYRWYTGGQMAAFRLCSGVVCVALVSRYLLGEEIGPRKFLGFGIMVVAMLLIASGVPDRNEAEER